MENDHADYVYTTAPYYCPLLLIITFYLAILIDKKLFRILLEMLDC